MAQVQLATRVDRRVKRAVEAVCETRGMKLARFVEDALLDKLEELEDIEDVKRIRFEPTRTLAQVLKRLKLDGKI
jgi:antitoxin component of RelBE/YafQ-DinJ toxin-antitoxin module